jgi:hypothetical protein
MEALAQLRAKGKVRVVGEEFIILFHELISIIISLSFRVSQTSRSGSAR